MSQDKTVIDYIKDLFGFGDDEDDEDVHPKEAEEEYVPHDPEKYELDLERDPPESFEPLVITNQEPAPKVAPPQGPPKPYRNKSVLQAVDRHAVQVAQEDQKNVRQLVWQLIYAREISNELEKARAIFTWCCSKDFSQVQFDGEDKDGSPEKRFADLRAGKTTVAIIFDLLCSYSGLHSSVIRGFAKGSDYTPGMKFDGDTGRHSWDAVYVNGEWHLLDCYWAARRLAKKEVDESLFHQEIDEYYFMPDPRQLIFTHFPDDSKWQLLRKPMKLEDFENMVALKASFFKHDLQVMNQKKAVVRFNKETTIRIACPKKKADTIGFTFSLVFGETGSDQYEGRKLSQFGMHEKISNVGFFTIRPPKKGSYRLVIFAKEGDEKVYGGVCEYELNCEEVYPEVKPFPTCAHTTWGQGDSFQHYDLQPQTLGAIIKTRRGTGEVKFKIPCEMRFSAKLKSCDKGEKELQPYVMQRVINDTAYFTINAPEPGEYGLEIFANDPERDGNSLRHVYQYLFLVSDVRSKVEPLPILPPAYLGPQPTFKKMGLVAESHPDPFFDTDDGDWMVTFKMDPDIPLRMSAQLLFASNQRNDDMSEYILQQTEDNTVTFVVVVPKPGFYRFQIFALGRDEERETLPGVYNYLIQANSGSKKAKPYPIQFGIWKKGGYLYKPLERDFTQKSHKKVDFRLKAPNAQAVAAVVGDKWTQLTQRSSGAWEGQIELTPYWNKEDNVTICAKFDTGKQSYSTLLEYKMEKQ